jgi:hypothetical protein
VSEEFRQLLCELRHAKMRQLAAKEEETKALRQEVAALSKIVRIDKPDKTV